MNHLAQSYQRVEKDVIVRVIRMLHGKGQLQVNAGREVSPDEILGSCYISAGFRIVNLSSLLSVAPEQVERYLQRKLGQKIYKGELLASKSAGFFSPKKEIISPTDGILDFLNPKTGELKISFLPKKAELPAGVYGVVEKVDNNRGLAVIRTQVNRVYGMLGSGRLRDGILHIISTRDDVIPKNKIEQRWESLVLAGGSIFLKDAILSAISQGVTGIVTGGIEAKDYRGMAGGRLTIPRRLDSDVGISIVVTEGFGSIPIGEDIYKILCQHEGKFVFIDGNRATLNLPVFSSSSMEKIKNTHLPPFSQSETYTPHIAKEGISKFEKGVMVRVIGNSYLGEQGKLLVIDDLPTLLPSSLRSYLATVETARRKIQVPIENLQVIM